MLRKVARGPELSLSGVAVLGECSAVVCEDTGAQLGEGFLASSFKDEGRGWGSGIDMGVKKRGKTYTCFS